MSDTVDIQLMVGHLIRIGVVKGTNPGTATCRLRVATIRPACCNLRGYNTAPAHGART